MIVNYFSDLYDDLHKQKVPFFKYQRGGDVGLYLSFYRTKISINPGNILIYVILCNILATSDFAETADLFTRSTLTNIFTFSVDVFTNVFINVDIKYS